MPLVLALACLGLVPALQEETGFERFALTTEFYSEGATFADLDRDGHGDMISGPFWYAGPDFAASFELYPPKTFDPLHYSDNFFAWTYDFDGDDWLDVLFVGFPGQDARWLRNPGEGARTAGHWEQHRVFDVVDNESPGFDDLTGDGKPELFFHSGGRFGWAAPGDDPTEPWVFHPISEDIGLPKFVHGLGLGDVNGDGRKDLLERNGWWEQPASLEGDPLWTHHPVKFTNQIGGAQMFAYDVNADGRADVITSQNGHGYGLSWYEQDAEGAFVEHVILPGDPPEDPDDGVFSQLHALDLVDMNGDGLRDIVTGKRWWAHGPEGDPEPNAPAVVQWFELRRHADGSAEFLPHLIDADSGVGVQVTAGDVNGDGKPDVAVGNKKGAFVFLNRGVADETGYLPRDEHGRPLNLDFETGDLRDWTATGTAFEGQPIRGDTIAARGREPSLHQGEYWIGGYELVGDEPTGTLTSAPFRVTAPWASFLLGGGAYQAVQLELHRKDGELAGQIYTTSAMDYESMQRVVVDLREHVGGEIFVRLDDQHSWSWGHLNFDDFRFHAERPAFELAEIVPRILPLDPVLNSGLSSTDAPDAMTVPAGFRVELIAGEPDLHQPIALTIDDRGRLWVVEARSYPERRPDGEGKDTLLVFEDEDGDGSFEKRTVFADDLNLVSGLEVGFGGVWIGAAPYLLFLPDRNDDLVPDGPPEVLLDGWGLEDTHETLNAFNWGPDGWLYGCHGVFTHSRVGKPGTPDDERTPLNAGVWRFHPLRREFEVFAWGTSNPWGVDFDANGQAFITACVIPHLYHMVQGGRYQRQAGRHFNDHVYADIQTIADHRHYVGDNPHGGNLRSNSVGGGHAHCGALLYLGQAFPEEYRGSVLMNNIHGNRVNNDRLEPNGSGFVGRHGDDFLLANDQWFRGINLKADAAGSVYLIDWYDERACHDTRPEVWDRTNGRLYRISYGAHTPQEVNLAALSNEELARLQLSSNEWIVRRARTVLQARAPGARVHALLREALERNPDPEKQLRALWALHVTDGLDEDLALAQLESEHEYLRAWAIQLLVEDRQASAEGLAAFARLAREDASPVVRLYLASALQRLPLDRRWEIAAGLAAHTADADDPNIPFVLWYGVEPLVPANPQRALALANETPIEMLARFIARRAAADAASRAELVRTMLGEDERDRRTWMLEEMAVALRERRDLSAPAPWPELYTELSFDPDAHVRDLALELAVAFGDRTAFADLRDVLANPQAPHGERTRALEALVRGEDRDAVAVFQQILVESELRSEALRALARFDDAGTPRAILANYEGFSDLERRDALNTLSSRPGYARALLTAVDRGDVPREDVGAFVVRQIKNLRDEEVDELLASTWGLVRDTDEDLQGKVVELTARLTPETLASADLPKGRDLFAKNCAQCHVLYDGGGNLGPELTGSNRYDLEYLLTNMVDPNAVIGRDYRATMAWLYDGRLVTGIEVGRTESAVTLRTENEELVVALDDVEDLVLSELSAMPEGLVDPLSPEEIRDLVAYLQSESQVPRRATPSNVGTFFDGESLDGWVGNPDVFFVENGEIVGSTEGLGRNEFLQSELELHDFRLTLEVRLAGDAGNSGIQFRSRPYGGGSIEGYQADIGPGWWGKLYEEHGRGLIWDRGGEDHVNKDGWNTYEILAVDHHVRTWLNGHLCVDLEDPDGATSGVVAFQVHSGGPTEIRFRNFQLELDPTSMDPLSSH